MAAVLRQGVAGFEQYTGTKARIWPNRLCCDFNTMSAEAHWSQTSGWFLYLDAKHIVWHCPLDLSDEHQAAVDVANVMIRFYTIIKSMGI